MIAAFLKSSTVESSGIIIENDVSVDNLNVTLILIFVECFKFARVFKARWGNGKANMKSEFCCWGWKFET